MLALDVGKENISGNHNMLIYVSALLFRVFDNDLLAFFGERLKSGNRAFKGFCFDVLVSHRFYPPAYLSEVSAGGVRGFFTGGVK